MSEPRFLVARLLETPGIARVIPQLPPEVLHRVLEHTGLEACAEIVTLATPAQLQRVLDLDLWRPPVAGADETFDAARFAEWLELLAQLDGAVAADRLAAMDVDVVVAGLAAHVRVFDGASVSGYVSLDGEHIAGRRAAGISCDVGGFVMEARSPRAWNVMAELLVHVHDERPGFFHHLMRRLVALSSSDREIDGCDGLPGDRDQQMTDLAIGREERRDRQGYVAPAQARAFLHAARALRFDEAQPPVDPIAMACLREMVPAAIVADDAPPVQPPVDDTAAVTAVMAILSDAGVVVPPRALLPAASADDSRLVLVRSFAESDIDALQSLAFLTNALASGCSRHGRALTPHEASEVVLATCNLGLENWPPAWPARGLLTAFRIGWTLVHRDVCLHAAARLIEVLATLECHDRDEHWALQTLRRELIRAVDAGEPWRARDGLDALLMLDTEAWAVLRALLDECPAMHVVLTTERVRAIDPADVTPVARNVDIARARLWLASLTSMLTA